MRFDSHSGSRDSGRGWEIRKTIPGATGGVIRPFEHYSGSGNRDSGGCGNLWKTAPGAGRGVNMPSEQYPRSGNRDSGWVWENQEDCPRSRRRHKYTV